MSRVKKLTALCFHYNISLAVCASLLVGVLCAGLPLVVNAAVPVRLPFSAMCGMLAFFVFLFFGPFFYDLVPFHASRLPTVFLDKACIHQADEKLKRDGIENLGGVLEHSETLVVLYSKDYTQKLWTVYELGCFLSAHHVSQVIWLPVDLPPLILVGMVCVVVLGFVYLVLEDLAFSPWLAVVSVLPCWILLVRALQHLARYHTQAEADLQNFSVRKATCCVESDRQWVEANVVACMRNLKRVHANSTAEEALATFDALVQQTMPQAIQVSVGRVGVGYKPLLPIVVAWVLAELDNSARSIRADDSAQKLVADLLVYIILDVTCVPLGVALALRLHACPFRACPFQTRLAGALRTFCVSVLSFAFMCFLGIVLIFFRDRAVGSAAWFAALCCVGLLPLGAMMFTFRPDFSKDEMTRERNNRH